MALVSDAFLNIWTKIFQLALFSVKAPWTPSMMLKTFGGWMASDESFIACHGWRNSEATFSLLDRDGEILMVFERKTFRPATVSWWSFPFCFWYLVRPPCSGIPFLLGCECQLGLGVVGHISIHQPICICSLLMKLRPSMSYASSTILPFKWSCQNSNWCRKIDEDTSANIILIVFYYWLECFTLNVYI